MHLVGGFFLLVLRRRRHPPNTQSGQGLEARELVGDGMERLLSSRADRNRVWVTTHIIAGPLVRPEVVLVGEYRRNRLE